MSHDRQLDQPAEIVEALAVGPLKYISWRAFRHTRGSVQEGLLVVRPDFAAYLPTKECVVYAGLVGRAAVDMALSTVGVIQFQLPGGPAAGHDIARVIEAAASNGDPTTFCERLEQATEQLGGELWRRSQVEVYREKIAGRKDYLVVFADRDIKIKGAPAAADLVLVEQWLPSWHAGGVLAPPRDPFTASHGKWLIAGSVVCLLVVAVQLLWQGIFAGGFLLSSYIVAGVLVMVGLGLAILGTQIVLRARDGGTSGNGSR